MMCVVCLTLVKLGKLSAPRPAICTIRGTTFCNEHGLRKASQSEVINHLAQDGIKLI